MKKYTEITTGITLLKQPWLGLSLMHQFSDFVYFNYTIEEALKVARQTDSEEIIQKRTINHLRKWFDIGEATLVATHASNCSKG